MAVPIAPAPAPAPAGPVSGDAVPPAGGPGGPSRSGGFAAQSSPGPSTEGVARTQPWPGSSSSTGQAHVPAPPAGSGGHAPSSGSSSGGHGPSGGGPRGGGNGGSGGNARPVLLGVAAVVALIAAVAFVLTLGGDDDPNEAETGGSAAAQTTTTPPSTEAAQQTTTTAPPADDPFVNIDSISVEDGQYLVNFTVVGFDPSPDAGGYHTHFYLDDVEAVNAGANGPNPGDWSLTYETSTFLTSYGPTDLSSRAAENMCALVADSAHGVAFPDTTTGNCIPLPAE
jgi:hypothetical protein